MTGAEHGPRRGRDDAQERTRLARLVRDLEAIETDEPASPEQLAREVARANRDRAARGLPPLRDDDDPPEVELSRRGHEASRQRDIR